MVRRQAIIPGAQSVALNIMLLPCLLLAQLSSSSSSRAEQCIACARMAPRLYMSRRSEQRVLRGQQQLTWRRQGSLVCEMWLAAGRHGSWCAQHAGRGSPGP